VVTKMKTHPVAELFPMLSDSDLREMADSIAQDGQLNPCVRQDGVLIDGRNRLAACKLAGVEPRFTEYKGDSPVSFIIGVNLARRHMDKGQKIALAIEIEPHFAKEAKKRKCGGQGGVLLVANVPQAKSRDKAAKAVGVSGKLVSAAKAIKAYDSKHGTDFLKKIMAGTLTVAKAKKLIKAEQDKRELAAAQKSVSASKKKSVQSVCDLRVCSCAELFKSGIKPDAVITDPPYPASSAMT